MNGGLKMSNQLQKVFEYQGNAVRTVTVEGAPWFVAKDVCDILEHSNSRMALDRLDDDEKGVSSIDTLGGNQEVQVVNEPGLYNLVLGSRKPEAKAFKRWVTHEVLPAIRRHGMYAVEELLDNPDLMIKTFTALKEEREKTKRLELQSAQQSQIINELSPKATYYDLVLQNKSLLAITKIAKDYGMSGTALNALLHELSIQYKQGDVWLLYQKYADKGYTQSKTHVIDDERNKFHTYWTQKGRLFIYDLLKGKKGILPLIEREGLRLVANK
jgi:prophage antirepressor-like protein